MRILPMAATAALLLAGACKKATPPPTPPAVAATPPVEAAPPESVPEEPVAVDLYQTAMDAGRFGEFLRMVDATELAATLQEPGPFTVFVPSDDAMLALGPEAMEHIMDAAHSNGLGHALQKHILAGRITSADLAQSDGAQTLGGSKIKVGVADDGTTTINGKRVVQSDIEAANGVIHVVDGMLATPKQKKRSKKKKNH